MSRFDVLVEADAQPPTPALAPAPLTAEALTSKEGDVPLARPPEPEAVAAASGGGGLWGHSGTTQVPHWRIMAMLLVILFGYSGAMFTNGAAARLISPRFLVAPGASSTSSLALVVHVFDPMTLIASFRVIITLFGLVPLMLVMKDAPTDVWQLPSTPRMLLVPVAIGFTNSLGFLPYMMLTAASGVALWAALVGLYVVGPVTYGLVFRGESRAPRKLAGVALCVVAAVLLALPKQADPAAAAAGDESLSDGGDLTALAKLALFLACITTWAVCDTMAAYVGRDVHPLHVNVLVSIGFGVTALVCSMTSYFLVASAGSSALAGSAGTANATLAVDMDPNTRAVGSGGASGYLLLLLAQCGGVVGNLMCVKLGMASEGSAFLPLCCLYTVLTAILSVAFLGEVLSPEGWSGIALGGCGMVMIATSA